MPAFYILVFVGLVAFVFLASSLYKPIGRYIRRIVEDAKNNIEDEDDDEEE